MVDRHQSGVGGARAVLRVERSEVIEIGDKECEGFTVLKRLGEPARYAFFQLHARERTGERIALATRI